MIFVYLWLIRFWFPSLLISNQKLVVNEFLIAALIRVNYCSVFSLGRFRRPLGYEIHSKNSDEEFDEDSESGLGLMLRAQIFDL